MLKLYTFMMHVNNNKSSQQAVDIKVLDMMVVIAR